MSQFTDAKGWYPGLELRGEDLFFRDIDASVVVPSKDNRRYTTRVAGSNRWVVIGVQAARADNTP